MTRHLRHAPRRRPRGVGLAVLGGPPAADPPPVASDPAWADGIRRATRIAVWALPVHALAYLWLTLAGYAGTATTVGGQRVHIVAAVGWLLGLVGMVALAGLLAGLRGRLLAGLGLLVGLAAVTLLLPQLVGPAYADHAGAAGAGALLLSVAWLLFGAAVWCSPPLNRADALMLLAAAPLLGVVGFFLPLLVPLGALLLAAAGVGLAGSGGRALPAAQPA